MAEQPVSCKQCGSDTDGVHKPDCPTQQVTIIDKRGAKKEQPTPSAEELMEQTGGPGPIADVTPTPEEFAKQQAEQAAWDAMSDEEKQEVLARQAAEMEANPYGGGGIQTEQEEGKQQVISYFAVIIMDDGTALATDNMDVSGFEKKFDITGPMIRRACSEIYGEVCATETATQTVLFMKQQAMHEMAQAHASALGQQLGKRGVAPGGRRR